MRFPSQRVAMTRRYDQFRRECEGKLLFTEVGQVVFVCIGVPSFQAFERGYAAA